MRLGIHFWIQCFCLLPLAAQVQSERADKLTQQQFIQGCASYRQSVIDDIEAALSEFAYLTNGLASTSANPEVHIALRDGIIQATLREEQEVSKGSISRAILKLSQNDSMALRLYQDWIDDHSMALTELQFLVSSKVLDPNPPYKLGNLREVWKEFSFYDLCAHQTMADIGAGNGLISFILLESGLPLNIILTEVDEDFLQLLDTKVDRYKQTHPEYAVQVLPAGERQLGLEGQKVDRMIFREVYHHLRNPEAILQDISRHLTNGGLVILKEGTRDLEDKDHKQCPKATTYKQIIKQFNAAGLILIQEEVIDGSYMLKFKL